MYLFENHPRPRGGFQPKSLANAHLLLPHSTYYKPMKYYKPTPLFSSKFLYKYRMLIYGIFVYSYISSVCIISPPLFRGDVKKIAHRLIIRIIQYV